MVLSIHVIWQAKESLPSNILIILLSPHVSTKTGPYIATYLVISLCLYFPHKLYGTVRYTHSLFQGHFTQYRDLIYH